jgi:hypothetical protein
MLLRVILVTVDPTGKYDITIPGQPMNPFELLFHLEQARDRAMEAIAQAMQPTATPPPPHTPETPKAEKGDVV